MKIKVSVQTSGTKCVLLEEHQLVGSCTSSGLWVIDGDDARSTEVPSLLHSFILLPSGLASPCPSLVGSLGSLGNVLDIMTKESNSNKVLLADNFPSKAFLLIEHLTDTSPKGTSAAATCMHGRRRLDLDPLVVLSV